MHAVGWQTLTKPKKLGGVGLRNLDEVNKVCLMKLGWKLQNQSKELWCDVLRSKYITRKNGELHKCKPYDSPLWKDIVKCIPDMLQLGSWCIGDGKSIRAWEDKWLGNICLNQLNLNIPSTLSNARVSDLLADNGDWNYDLFQGWLPLQWLNRLQACLPPRRGDIIDNFCFAGTSNEEFSFKEVFEVVSQFEFDQDMSDDWTDIWKLKVSERCRTFIWLLRHDRLMTNYSKSRKGMGSAACNLCGHVCENTMHAIRDCGSCRQLWQSIVLSNLRVDFFRMELYDWIKLNLQDQVGVNKDWKELWAITCHELWSWRNTEYHIDTFKRPLEPVLHIMARKKAYDNACRLMGKLEGVDQSKRLVGCKYHP